ncbi:MAG: Holliday junction DNA helicase RuvA [Planctomycetota bacterium]
MYEYLEGRIAEQTPTRLVLAVGGIGFELSVPLGAVFALDKKQCTKVFTHFIVREDVQKLFGFPDASSRELFRLLLSAKGVGPGLALTVLSGLPRLELLTAIAGGETAPLLKIKGLGRKRADQILLDLRERAIRLLALEENGSPRGMLTPIAPSGSRGSLLDDAVAALISIGFNEKEARKNVEVAANRSDSDDLETLVRLALQK